MGQGCRALKHLSCDRHGRECRLFIAGQSEETIMSIGDYCNREVVVIDRGDSVREAVNLMRSNHVGTVVVVEGSKAAPVPVGILTDRDIVLEILAEDVELNTVSAGDVMSYELVTAGEHTVLPDAIALMHSKGIRRLPVVDDRGGLVGILSVDDVIELLAEELVNIASLIGRGHRQEQKKRS